MGSSSKSGNHSPKKRSSSSSDSSSDDEKHNRKNHPIHTNQPPYPVPPVYPPPPCYGPYAGYPNGYAAGQGHPNAYYYPQGAAGAAYYGQRRESAASSFLRGFILCSFFMLMGLFLCSLILNLMLLPEAPHYKVESFSVSNFNTASSSLSADWASKITIENPNQKLNAFFSTWKVTVFHHHVGVARSFLLEGFELETHQNRQFNVNLSSNAQNSPLLIPIDAVEDIAKERAKGSITVGLGISTIVNFKYHSSASRHIPIYALCADLKLDFQGNSSSATAILNDNNKNCQLVDEF
ncbi:hypothetical protein L6164_033929 [Bauhinia variegata]|uniref:Uncharacterized protein n=1 Tax=Bauhinia variegata TaxID=167791 RepID=A0ACB9KTC2_BAUVA|nr:hypothetical protein L6164_033929 [Bauhinia variegata]